MQVWSLLYTRRPRQFDVSSSRRIGGFIGAADSARGWPAIRIGSVTHESNIPLCESFLQALVLSFRFSTFFVGAGEPAGAAAICPADRAPIAHAINNTNTANFFIRSCWVLR